MQHHHHRENRGPVNNYPIFQHRIIMFNSTLNAFGMKKEISVGESKGFSIWPKFLRKVSEPLLLCNVVFIETAKYCSLTRTRTMLMNIKCRATELNSMGSLHPPIRHGMNAISNVFILFDNLSSLDRCPSVKGSWPTYLLLHIYSLAFATCALRAWPPVLFVPHDKRISCGREVNGINVGQRGEQSAIRKVSLQRGR